MTGHPIVAARPPRKRYIADGSQTVFSFDFVAFRPDDVLVLVDGAPAGAAAAVTLLDDGTGVATFAQAPAAGAAVVVLRRLSIRRESDFQEGGDLRAKTLNDEFDFLTAALQQVESAASRALHVPDTDPDGAAATLPAAAARASKILAFDAAGNPALSSLTLAAIEAGPASAEAAAASAAGAAASASAAAASASGIGVPVVNTFDGDGATTGFALSAAPPSANAIQVFISGVHQARDRYAFVGTALTFAVAPPRGTGNIEVRIGAFNVATSVPAANVQPGSFAAGAFVFPSSVAAGSFVASGATVPANGMYSPAANRVGFAAAGNRQIQIWESASTPVVDFYRAAGATNAFQFNFTASEASFFNKETTAINFKTPGGIQASVLHTASVNRAVTLTGSNGGNPIVGASGGALALRGSGLGSNGVQIQDGAGALVMDFISASSAVNRMVLQARETGTPPQFYAVSDAGLAFGNGTTGPLSFNTNMASTPVTQFQVLHAAGANRNATVTGSNGGNPAIGVTGGKLAISAALVLSQATLLETSVALANGAGAAAGTLANAPAAGNPTKWIPINDNGTTRHIPAW